MEDLKYENTYKRGENDPRRSPKIRPKLHTVNQKPWKTRQPRRIDDKDGPGHQEQEVIHKRWHRTLMNDKEKQVTTRNHEAHGENQRGQTTRKSSLFSFFFRGYCNSSSFITNVYIPYYFISFNEIEEVCNSRWNNSCVGSPSISYFCFVSHFHISPFERLLYINLYSFYIYLLLFHPKEKYKDLYSIKYNLFIEIYKDRFQEGFVFFGNPSFPSNSHGGELKTGNEVYGMNGRKVVFDKKPGQVGWVEQDIVDKCVAESLQGLDAKLGIRRTCPVKGVV